MAKCTTFAKKQYGGITKAIESKGLQSLHEEVGQRYKFSKHAIA